MTSSRLESAEIKATLEAIKRLPGPSLAWKTHGNVFTGSGISDIICIYLGNVFLIEMKRRGKYAHPEDGLSVPQRDFLTNGAKAGAVKIVADNPDDVIVRILATPERH